jgi:hypothetical protein
MNHQKSSRFGGVIGGGTEHLWAADTGFKGVVVRPSGFEPPTFCSGGKRSIQLSYGRMYRTALRLYARQGWAVKQPDVLICFLPT